MHDDPNPTLTPVDDTELAATEGGSVLGDLWNQVIAPDLEALHDAVRWVSDQILQ